MSNYDQLYDHIETINTIKCVDCRVSDLEFQLDSMEAAEEFHKRGWRFLEEKEIGDEYLPGGTFCPDCSKKNKRK